MHRSEITADVAARLVAGQFPQWAGLPVVAVKTNGWDNITSRLGSEMSIRLPSADSYAAQVGKEHRWLPVLSRQLPLPIPEPVAIARPAEGFPRPWSIYRWIEGEPASAGQVADPARFASDLAGFLRALYAIDGSDGPAAGAHGFFRGGPLATWDEQVRRLISVMADDIDAKAVIKVWDTARLRGSAARGHRLRMRGRWRPGLRSGDGVDVSSPATPSRRSAAASALTEPPGLAAVAGHSGRPS